MKIVFTLQLSNDSVRALKQHFSVNTGEGVKDALVDHLQAVVDEANDSFDAGYEAEVFDIEGAQQ